MRGDFKQAMSLFVAKEQRGVATFVGGARTDTIEERHALERDVYPFIRAFGKRLGIPIVFFDGRWGHGRRGAAVVAGGRAGDAAASAATATDPLWTVTASKSPCECEQDISYCVHEYSGMAFVGLLGSKYGDRL